MAISNTPPPVNWQAIFRKHSWWFDRRKQRLFLITSRYYDDEGLISEVDLLEERQEWPVRLPISKMIRYFDKELLVTVSVMGEYMELEIVNGRSH